MIHLYCGDGKGKTTAAMGLALRALGQGKRVVILQFLKDGTSGELSPLESLGARVLSGPPDTGFVSQMNETEKKKCADWCRNSLEQALDEECDMLILDEFCAALRHGMVPENLARRAVLQSPADRETVVTGRNPAGWIKDAADYITEMRCERHPYQKGIAARRGIEY